MKKRAQPPAYPKRSEGQTRRWAARREAIANGQDVPTRTLTAEAIAQAKVTIAAKVADGYRFPTRGEETREKQRKAALALAARRRQAAKAREEAAE